MNPIIAPSILSADFAHLQRDIEMINSSAADWFHVDIMDGVFVPNISFGFPIMESLKKFSHKPLDVHLMIVDPQRYIQKFSDAGAAIITVHFEACTHLHRVIQLIKDCGCKAGVALNPHTPISQLEDILPEIDLALVMSVNPGFGGQSFIPNTLKKVSDLRAMADNMHRELIIEVDGGINLKNKNQLLQAGANALVAGNAIFNTESPLDTIQQFKSIDLPIHTI
ncbi:MAG: ribulose-phosphate 3-epimerase [Pedobacter sp.]|nr:MAG: ribulose-phosphate 3-epimerase [Pedobacter sp.]